MTRFLDMLNQGLARAGQKPVGVWVLLLGMTMTLGFAPFGLWPVAVLSLAGLWWLVKHAQSMKQAAGAALVWGMGHGITALYWLPWAFYKDADNSLAAAVGGGVPAVVGLAFFNSLTYILASVLAFWVGKRTRWGLGAVVWVVAIVGLEFIKGLHPMGFPWLPVGAIFATSLPMMQAASLGGVWLLSLLGLLMAVLVANARVRCYGCAFMIAALMAVFGLWRLQHNPPAAGADMIRVVQPNIQSAHKWDPQTRWNFLQETLHVALDGDAAGTKIPETIVMPETAVAFYLDEEDDVRLAIASRLNAALPDGGGLVTGSIRREADPARPPPRFLPRFYNSFVAMDTLGNLRGVYDKQLLVPFGEYIPLHALLDKLPLPVPIRTLSQSRIDFTHGTRPPVLPSPAGDFMPLICYEGIFPWHVDTHAREVRYLVNITNDGWFTGTIALYQHAALGRLRAVETGLPFVRVANTGITVVYDPLGREVVKLPINTEAKADLALPKALPTTPLLRLLGTLERVAMPRS